MVDMKEVQEFFFKAMIQGWACGVEKINMPNMPGYKKIEFRDGNFYLADLYCVTPESDKSAGTTTIWVNGIPVWWMSFNGFYNEKAIAFLKEALLDVYSKHIFLGGRGPRGFKGSGMTYINNPWKNDFSDFEGKEEILVRGTRQSLGWHRYRGMSLL